MTSLPILPPDATLIGTLFRDTALQVTLLADGAAPPDAACWRERAMHLVPQLRSALTEHQVPDAMVDEICYAQCALLDEQALAQMARSSEAAWSVWAAEPLQVHFFGNYNAGEEVYQRIAALQQQATPSPLLVGSYRTMLSLGFIGRHSRLDAPERLAVCQGLDTLAGQPALPALQVAAGASRWLAFWRRYGLLGWTLTALLIVLLLWLLLGWHMSSLAGQLARGGT